MKILKFEKGRLHILAWIVYIVYERLSMFYVIGRFANFWNYVAVYLVDITFFYFNAHIVFPNAVKEKKK